MFKILNMRDGAVLNHNSGNEREAFLETVVEGVCQMPGRITVNGIPAERDRLLFQAPVRLNGKFNDITVKMKNPHGEFQQKIKVIWDKKSFRRYNFFIDDNIFFLTDIFRENPKSIFDHFYLKKLRDIHERYGTKFTLNLFYHNAHSDFEIKDFPDKYKSEWLDNAGWLKLSFHAYSEFPACPYLNAPPQKLAGDYDLLKEEVIRFAGEKSFQAPILLHWVAASPACINVLKKRGVKLLCGSFHGKKSYTDEKGNAGTFMEYSLDSEKLAWLREKNILYDFEKEMLFCKISIICNRLETDKIKSGLEEIFKNTPENETICIGTHEQYFFKYYPNYIPEHFERIETAVRMLGEENYKPVFFSDGFSGAEE